MQEQLIWVLGVRWLQGCYVDKDGLLSKISTMQEKEKNLNCKLYYK